MADHFTGSMSMGSPGRFWHLNFVLVFTIFEDIVNC